MIPHYLSTAWTAGASALGNHLWQSTLFVGVAGLLTLVLRKNQASARYWLWLTASVKFVIPFSLLVGIGGHIARPHALAEVQPSVLFAMGEISQPFLQPTTSVTVTTASVDHLNFARLIPAILLMVWLCGFIIVLSVWRVRWRRISKSLLKAVPLCKGREVEALRRLERIGGVRKRVKLLLSTASVEPGIFGIVRPVLVWPERISERLADAQLEAILAHEMCHVRRLDNLTAAIHMMVEAIFWFNPLVWWLGARLVEERERACDEEVLHLCKQPHIYAEGILKVCEFCVESPLACVSGVTGSDLKKRMARIMSERAALRLDFGKKSLLLASGLIVVGVPILLGQINAKRDSAALQSESQHVKLPVFDVVSVKPSEPGAMSFRSGFTPDGFSSSNTPLLAIIQVAYGLLGSNEDQITGAPSWVKSEKYDIEAKVNGADLPEFAKLNRQQRDLMLQTLLADRFKLTASRDIKQLPVYALVVAMNGPKLKEAKSGDTYVNGIKGPNGPIGPGANGMGKGYIVCQRTHMAELTWLLRLETGRTVLDKTGLTGQYDVSLQWTPEEGTAQMSSNDGRSQQETTSALAASGPSLFTAIQEQLGLRLESEKGPVEGLVVDHMEKPSPN
jgi:bla regulator protein BlaR1